MANKDYYYYSAVIWWSWNRLIAEVHFSENRPIVIIKTKAGVYTTCFMFPCDCGTANR